MLQNHSATELYPSPGVHVLNDKEIIFLMGLGFRTQSFALAKQMLYCLRHNSDPFCSGYFVDRVL
jgi:hypothetical protein